MARVATARLIEAAATLDPVNRAVLNMWVHRGLPDEALARMAGLSGPAITSRKLDIVEHLSVELGLPPYEVVAALRAITPPPPAGPPPDRTSEPVPAPQVARARDPEGAATASPETAAQSPEITAQSPEITAESPDGPEVAAPPRRSAPPSASPQSLPPLPDVRLRRGRSALGPLTGTTRRDIRDRRRALRFLLPTVALAAVLVAALLHVDRGATEVALQMHGPPGIGLRSASSSRSASGSRARTQVVLAPLPGGDPSAHGEIAVVRRGNNLALRLAVSGLPAPRDGHYEVWLYTTVIDSTALGRLPASGRSATLRLPRSAARFRWVDVSFQPRGQLTNSGESVLRTVNPLAGRASG